MSGTTTLDIDARIRLAQEQSEHAPIPFENLSDTAPPGATSLGQVSAGTSHLITLAYALIEEHKQMENKQSADCEMFQAELAKVNRLVQAEFQRQFPDVEADTNLLMYGNWMAATPPRVRVATIAILGGTREEAEMLATLLGEKMKAATHH